MSKKNRTKLFAKLVTENRKPCAFCHREVDDEITYGKLYSIGDIQCHYFCVLLSCCLIQKGKDNEGLFGFLYPDILAEVERSKKHRCSFCNKDGASLGCCVSQCRKQFHLPCGRERDAVSLFYGNYKSFCKVHAPKQKVTDNVMAKVKLRSQASKKSTKPLVKERNIADDDSLKTETVCLICYEEVVCCPSPRTFWPPCCARDAWFHRSCVQRMCLSAGMHYLKCPLCNDKESFYQAVINQGFYVPDRDAAWELEQNAFAEIYERELSCGLDTCECPAGRGHDDDHGPWDIKLCLLCGASGAHAQCLLESGCSRTRYVCGTCSPAAPDDLDQLAMTIENAILSEQTLASRRPVMPGRMSLRRTKQRQNYCKNPGSSSQNDAPCEPDMQDNSNTASSRQDLNLKKPRRQSQVRQDSIIHRESVLREVENKLFSPVKMIEQGLREKVKKLRGEENFVLEPSVVERVRQKFRKPKPLSEKKKIVDGILDDLVNTILKDNKKKEPIRTWCSPKKDAIADIKKEKDIEPEPLKKLETNQDPTEECSKKTPKSKKKHIGLHTDRIQEEIAVQDVTRIESKKNLRHNKSIQNYSDDISLQDEVHKESTLNELESKIVNVDDSSNSTFQLAPEFIADDSDTSIPIFDTPKKLKTVDIQKDSSLEISENDDKVNIDVVKIENTDKSENLKNFLKSPVDSGKSFKIKYSPTGKASLKTNKMDIDIESFKNEYLSEVDRGFKCNFNHKHKDEPTNGSFQMRTAIDFAIDAAFDTEKRKRKTKTSKNKAKKRKLSGLVLKYENIDPYPKKRKKNVETEVSIKNDNMKVRISLKKQKFRLRIMQAEKPKTLKQYVLKCPDGKTNEIIGKPERDVTPIKRKYVKQEKSPDNLIQTSIHSFFKGKSKD